MDKYALTDPFLFEQAAQSGLLPANCPMQPSVKLVERTFSKCLSEPRILPPMRIQLIEMARHLGATDWLNFINQTGHREHLFHQVRVALIADFLSRRLWPSDVTRINGPALRAMLCAAGMLHDHAYALACLVRNTCAMFPEGVDASGERAKDMYSKLLDCYRGLFSETLVDRFCTPPLDSDVRAKHEQELKNDVRNAINEYLKDRVCLGEETVRRLSDGEEHELFDHGLWSALNIAARLSRAGMPWSSGDEKDLQPARLLVEAIAIHNRSDFGGPDFDITHNPLAGILFLADELHEWHRYFIAAQGQKEVSCNVHLCMSEDKVQALFQYDSKELGDAGWDLDFKRRVQPRLIGMPGYPSVEILVYSDGDA